MKKLHLFIIPSFFFFINIHSHSQSVGDIIKKYTEALGGTDNIKSVETLTMTGNVAVHGMDLPLEIKFKRPGKVRIEVKLQDMVQVQAFDGKTAWQIEFMKGDKPVKMTEEQAQNMKVMADFEGVLINYKKKGYTAALLGKELVDSIETYKIVLTSVSGDTLHSYINTETFLPVKRTRYNKNKDVTTETYSRAYKKFEGIMLPVSLEIKQGVEENTQKITFDKVEINPEIDDSIFKIPEPKDK